MDLETGAPTDELLLEAKNALGALGVQYQKVSEVVAAKDEKVDKAIMDGINKYNESQATSRAQKVQKYFLLDTDFSIAGEELGECNKCEQCQMRKFIVHLLFLCRSNFETEKTLRCKEVRPAD